MARLVTCGFELATKTGGFEMDLVTNGVDFAIVTSPVHTGTYALEASPTSTTVNGRLGIYAANTAAHVYAKFWINITTLPAANATISYLNTIAGSTIKVQIILTTTGTLLLANVAGGTIGSASSALSTGTWYCIEYDFGGTTNAAVSARLNGVQFASGNSTNPSNTVGSLMIGVMTSTTAVITFDDIAVNDSTGSHQNTFVGMSQLVRATPNAAGDINGFLTQVGGTAGSANNYTRVDELTPNGATSYNASITAASDLFAVGVATIPTGATINCVTVGGQSANLTGADTTASFQYQIEKTSAGTIAKGSAIIPDSTSFGEFGNGAGAANYSLVQYLDPDGAVWTPTTIRSMQIGYAVDVSNTDALAISNVFAYVDYTLNRGSFLPFM